MTEDAPKPTGKPPQAVTLTGMLFAWRMTGVVHGEPVLLAMPGSPAFYLPCFAEEGALRAFMARAGLAFDRIKRIDDGDVFLDDLPRELGGHELVLVSERVSGRQPWASG